MAVSPERAASAPQVNRHDTVGSTATCCCWLRCVRGYDARIWRICDAAAALLFAADAVVVGAAAAAAASRSDGRPTDEGVLPECGGELDHCVSAKCAAWVYRMRRSSTFGKGARWVCALSLAGRAGCGAGSGIQTCAHGGKILEHCSIECLILKEFPRYLKKIKKVIFSQGLRKDVLQWRKAAVSRPGCIIIRSPRRWGVERRHDFCQ